MSLVISIDGKNKNPLWEYIPAIEPLCIYDPCVGKFIKIRDLVYYCKICSKVVHVKTFSGNYTCKSCIIKEKHKIRNTTNILGDLLTYQSDMEKKFIDWCNENLIVIKDGPVIPYTFKGKKTKYIVDFIVKGTILVEIKDNHIWYKREVESGKWKAKEEAAKLYAKCKGYTFKLVFPCDMENFKDYISGRDMSLVGNHLEN